REIPYYLVLGLVCGIVAFLFITGLDFTEERFARMKVHWSLKPAIGAAGLALLGFIWLKVSGHVPPFYGNGYDVIRQLISIDTYQANSNGSILPSVPLVLAFAALAALKLVATCLTTGSGGSGGLFAPSLLVGAAVGA